MKGESSRSSRKFATCAKLSEPECPEAFTLPALRARALVVCWTLRSSSHTKCRSPSPPEFVREPSDTIVVPATAGKETRDIVDVSYTRTSVRASLYPWC